MKKKISFIDLFIDEWHANNYPKWFAEAPLGDQFEIAYAWEEAPKPEGRPLAKWCQEYGVTPVATLEEAVDKADCLCILAPSNPEVHERLSEYALSSGKPVYLDKPFAPSKAAAERIFARAAAGKTPLMSSSALRYADELVSQQIQAIHPDIFTTTGGGRSYHEYAIHQLEMIVSVMGTNVSRVIPSGDATRAVVILEYADGRRASLAYSPFYPFTVTAGSVSAQKSFVFSAMTNTFQNLIADILKFYQTGVCPIPQEQTVTIAALLEQTVAALEG